MKLTVGLTFNLSTAQSVPEGAPPDLLAEYDSETTVQAIAGAIRAAGHDVVLIEADPDAYQKLRNLRPDIVFNVAEGLRGTSRETHIPAMLEMLDIPYTGSSILSLALSFDKAAAKKVLAHHGVPTPRFLTVEPGGPIGAHGLRFPLFVKPAREGSSMGISPDSLVYGEAELAERICFVHTVYRQAALVEEFVGGREFTLGIVGNAEPTVLPIMEILFDRVPPAHGPIYSYQFKQEWDDWAHYSCPAEADAELAALLRATAIQAFGALGCSDVSRVDIRLDAHGTPQVLEINPLPGLVPGFSDLCRSAEKAGWDYHRLVGNILQAALERHGLVR